MQDAPVVVVGAGPTGLMAALLLARRGVRVVVLERHAQAYPLPRAVHLDDEVVRLLQAAGLAERFAALSRPSPGLRLLDRRHRTLVEFGRGAGAYGHPQANTFDQPDLERLLREELAGCPEVLLRSGVEVTDVQDGGRRVVLGDGEVLAAAAVLGCDGAHSLVRTSVVRAGWQDLRFEERWLVVDGRTSAPLDVWGGVSQVCDGRRAATFLQVGECRYRWEWQLSGDEQADDLARPEVLARLVAPWLAGTPGARLELLRSSGYTYRARLADRWRRDRVLLLGDAAHQTPPFVGQGLGLGLRDAANLAWKLAAVLEGRAPEELLDTYERERRPHARALVRLAVLAGLAMTGGQDRAAAVRRVVVRNVFRLPALRDAVLRRGSPPLVRGPLVPRARTGPGRLVGTLCPQPRVTVAGREVLIDALLGDGFAVVVDGPVAPGLQAVAARLRAAVVRVDALPGAGPVRSWLAAAGAGAVVVRPDRAVLLAARPEAAPRHAEEVLLRLGA